MWIEVHHELTETNPRFQMPEGQYSTTNYCGDNPGAVEWYFWVTGCGSCWNPCFNNRNPQFLTLYTHITSYYYIYIYCVDTSTCPGPLGQTFHLLTAAVENTKLIELAAAFGGAVAGLVQLP